MARKKVDLFAEWWIKKAKKRVLKIEKAWINKNEPNDQMMHNGDAYGVTMELAERVFLMGVRGEFWEMTPKDSLFCDLDEVIVDAYLVGKENQV
jgi:hypothetical protein